MTQHDPDVEVIRRYCPYYAAAAQMLAQRWAAGVLRALVTGPARFSDIANAIPGMTDKLLSQRLKDLEADGLVERRVHAGPAGANRSTPGPLTGAPTTTPAEPP
jgi:DNA-binding HxlR family transcriptional regulator